MIDKWETRGKVCQKQHTMLPSSSEFLLVMQPASRRHADVYLIKIDLWLSLGVTWGKHLEEKTHCIGFIPSNSYCCCVWTIITLILEGSNTEVLDGQCSKSNENIIRKRCLFEHYIITTESTDTDERWLENIEDTLYNQEDFCGSLNPPILLYSRRANVISL